MVGITLVSKKGITTNKRTSTPVLNNSKVKMDPKECKEIFRAPMLHCLRPHPIEASHKAQTLKGKQKAVSYHLRETVMRGGDSLKCQRRD